MRLISFNYSQLTETVITASSSNINFPSSNIKHEHRSKEWRSSGSFIVDSTNKTIVFDEGAGNLTATLTEGSYSISSLRTEIKSKMEAVGTQVYTVSFSEILCLWSISAPLSFTLRGTSSFLPVIGFNPTDVSGVTLTAASPAIHTQETVLFDLKTTEEIDSVVLLWGKDQYRLSGTAELRIQASATANFTTPAIDQGLTFNNDFEIASHYFSTPQPFRYWRILIKDSANPTGYVNIGVVILGMQESVGDPGNGFSFTQSDNSNITRNEFGQEYADTYPITSQLALDFSVMEYATAEKFILLYQRVGIRTPVFVAIDPEGAAFDKDCFSIYGKFRGPLTQKHTFHTLFDTGLTIQEIN